MSWTTSDCLPAVLDGSARDTGLRKLHHRYSTQRRTRWVEAITRLQESGQPVPDPERAAEALAGAVFYRRLMTPEPLRTDEVEGLVATVLGER
ncbi:TetR-like C-terminal domain-containing protein [Nocardioides sp. NPDC057772]|uniref:TetR-like C-terminal domain-containing protein n=1 Tax=Nocardioides sp. NPDC057772 TaxID=3346245 RepID=UPI003672A3BF